MTRGARALDPAMISTTLGIEGYRVVKSLGVTDRLRHVSHRFPH